MGDVLGIITARAGSKGLPNKNILQLGGKPLVQHSMDTVQESCKINRAILSTDITDVAELGKKYSKLINFGLRPSYLCKSDTSQIEVINYELDQYLQHGYKRPKFIALLQPTSPFRIVAEIDQAVQELEQTNKESLIGVCPVYHHPADYIIKTGKNKIKWVFRDNNWRRRQDFSEVFFDCGALYICQYEYFKKKEMLYDENSLLFELSQCSMFDIDSSFDLSMAEAFISQTSK